MSIAICVVQCAVFFWVNFAIFSVSKLRLEVAAASGNVDAIRVLDLRKDSNFTLCTIIWAMLSPMCFSPFYPILSGPVLGRLCSPPLSSPFFWRNCSASIFFTPRLANGIPAQTPAKCLRGVALSGSKAHGSASQLVARPRGNHTSSGAGLSSASRLGAAK
jgi:hypothetical protein